MRLNKRHSDMVRDKIRAAQLVNRLQDHAEGKIEMSSTQVDAAKYLLNKIIPNAPERREHTGPDGSAIPLSINVRFVGSSSP